MQKSIFFSVFIFLGIYFSSFLPAYAQSGQMQTGTYQCNDKKDNDGDGKRDYGKESYNDPDCTSTSDNSEGGTAGTPGTGEVKVSIKLKNPLGETDTISEAIKKIMDVVLTLALPFIVLFFIYSGFLFVVARGDPTKLGKAKNMFWYTLIGSLLILGAWTIANAIVNTVNDIAR